MTVCTFSHNLAGHSGRRVGRWAACALALCLALGGCAARGAAPAPTHTASQSGVAASSTAGWSSYRDPAYGFIVEYPSGATAIGNGATGATSLAAWRFANPQGGTDSATLEVTATTKASAGLCAQYTSGKPVTLAGGAVAYEQDNLSSATSQPQITAILQQNGLFTIITLTGQGSPATFMRRWGDAWSHILATFQPGHGPAGAQPCQ